MGEREREREGERERERERGTEREREGGGGDVNGSVVAKTESHNMISNYFMSSTEQIERKK